MIPSRTRQRAPAATDPVSIHERGRQANGRRRRALSAEAREEIEPSPVPSYGWTAWISKASGLGSVPVES
jgi:hypothetical protein